jgi:ribonuclease VapC
MIAVDTSALMAVVLDEPAAEACSAALAEAAAIIVSAGTVAEALSVAGRAMLARPRNG